MPIASKSELSQGQHAYLKIVGDIRSGTLRPGDRLTEAELAKRFEISRTPIREAIRQLEMDGLVVHVPRVGATVRVLDHYEISELYDMRTVLEGTAARFAARAASDVELGELRVIHQTMTHASTASELYAINRQFHHFLLAAARNRFLLKAVDTVHKTLLILGPSTMEQDERAQAVKIEHSKILAALEQRDPDAAEKAMRQHIEAAHTARLRLLRQTSAEKNPYYDSP